MAPLPLRRGCRLLADPPDPIRGVPHLVGGPGSAAPGAARPGLQGQPRHTVPGRRVAHRLRRAGSRRAAWRGVLRAAAISGLGLGGGGDRRGGVVAGARRAPGPGLPAPAPDATGLRDQLVLPIRKKMTSPSLTL